jgi:transposase InsO family protein
MHVQIYGTSIKRGKCRAQDNAFIEQLFGTLKRRHIYLKPAKDGLEL